MRNILNYLILPSSLILITNLFYQDNGGATPLITDPKLSSRCQNLLQTRNKKIQLRQKSMSLLERTKKLHASTPANKQKLLRKFTYIESELNHKLDVIKLEIVNLEEDLIRRGCPGINL